MKLDLGCGQNKKRDFEGDDTWTGVDLYSEADIKFDLFKKKWPWKDESIDEIYSSHFIEHLPDLIPFMNECHRILKTGAKMTVVAPYYSSVRATQDPTHKQFISEHSFLYYDKKWRESQGLDHYPITADFEFGYAHAWVPEWASRSDEAKRFALTHYNNVVTDILVTLTKR